MQYAQSPVNPYAQSSVVPNRQGHLRAMNNVACSFRDGEGVARDNVQALGWFALAAELDHDVMTSAGAMADPTRPNHKSAQRPFDWSAREQPEGTWAAQTGLEDEDEVYVERLGRAVPTAPRPTPNQKVWTLREAPTRLSYVALRRTYVRVSWQPE